LDVDIDFLLYTGRIHYHISKMLCNYKNDLYIDYKLRSACAMV